MARTKSAADRTPVYRRAAGLLKQVSDPTRLRVLMLPEDGERNVTAICEALGNQSQPAVSHHLALLRHGRLIESRRSGKNNVYSLTDQGRTLCRTIAAIAGPR